MDKSVNVRVKNQRRARIEAGWIEVRVWVPTKNDAIAVQELAAQLRANVLDMKSFEKLEGVQKMEMEFRKRILDAIAQQGSAEYATPSGAILELMSEFAKTGNLAEICEAHMLFVAAYPSNAKYVANSIGAKILNHYLIPSLGLNGAHLFLRWEKSNPEWATILAKSLQDGLLTSIASKMLDDIRPKAA